MCLYILNREREEQILVVANADAQRLNSAAPRFCGLRWNDGLGTEDKMRLTNCRLLGRYTRPDGNAVNVHKGVRVGRGTDILYYLHRNKRKVISEAEFYGVWKRVPNGTELTGTP